MSKLKTYCEHCNQFVEFTTKEKQKMYDEILKVEYLGTTCFCKICGNEVHSDDVDIFNMKKAECEYQHIISVEEIDNLLNKYDIGATVLSNILGWGEVTISRYKSGGKPSIRYSDKLIELYNNPYEMYELLIANKDNMKSIAYEKAMKAVSIEIEKYKSSNLKPAANSKINSNDIKENKDLFYDINLICDYILTKKDVTPKALQKILYFAQGFYYAFTKSWLFTDIPQAWQHGPVYPEIYQKYKDYRFNPIVVPDLDLDSVSNKLSDTTIKFLDNIIKYYSCYTGDALESVSHSEIPWLNARLGLNDDDSSNNPIDLDSIGNYFSSVINKYNMINYSDTKDYIIDMVSR